MNDEQKLELAINLAKENGYERFSCFECFKKIVRSEWALVKSSEHVYKILSAAVRYTDKALFTDLIKSPNSDWTPDQLAELWFEILASQTENDYEKPFFDHCNEKYPNLRFSSGQVTQMLVHVKTIESAKKVLDLSEEPLTHEQLVPALRNSVNNIELFKFLLAYPGSPFLLTDSRIPNFTQEQFALFLEMASYGESQEIFQFLIDHLATKAFGLEVVTEVLKKNLSFLELFFKSPFAANLTEQHFKELLTVAQQKENHEATQLLIHHLATKAYGLKVVTQVARETRSWSLELKFLHQYYQQHAPVVHRVALYALTLCTTGIAVATSFYRTS